MACCIMRHATLQFETKLQKCIRMGKPYSKFSFGEVYRLIYAWESHFTAPLPQHRKTKYPTVYLTNIPPQMKILNMVIPFECFNLFLDSSSSALWSAHVLSMPLLQTIWTLNWNQTASCLIRVYRVCYLQQT